MHTVAGAICTAYLCEAKSPFSGEHTQATQFGAPACLRRNSRADDSLGPVYSPSMIASAVWAMQQHLKVEAKAAPDGVVEAIGPVRGADDKDTAPRPPLQVVPQLQELRLDLHGRGSVPWPTCCCFKIAMHDMFIESALQSLSAISE